MTALNERLENGESWKGKEITTISLISQAGR